MTRSIFALGTVVTTVAAVTLGMSALGPELAPQAERSSVTQAPRAGEAGSALSDYLGFGHAPVADERQFNRDSEARERFMQTCMGKAGFEYFPGLPGTAVVKTIDGVFQIGPTESMVDQDTSVERNDRYVASLDDAAEARYWQTRHGFPHNHEGFTEAETRELDADGNGELTSAEMFGDSCISQAEDAIPGVFYAAKLIGDDVDRLQAEVDREVHEAGILQDLVECLASYGIKATVGSTVGSLSLGQATTALPPVAACIGDYKVDVAEVRSGLDAEFFAKHEAAIRQWGVRVP